MSWRVSCLQDCVLWPWQTRPKKGKRTEMDWPSHEGRRALCWDTLPSECVAWKAGVEFSTDGDTLVTMCVRNSYRTYRLPAWSCWIPVIAWGAHGNPGGSPTSLKFKESDCLGLPDNIFLGSCHLSSNFHPNALAMSVATEDVGTSWNLLHNPPFNCGAIAWIVGCRRWRIKAFLSW